MPDSRKTYRELDREYEERFGTGIGVPFGAFEFKHEDFIEEMEWALEHDIPFDRNSPRWRWVPDPLPEGAVI